MKSLLLVSKTVLLAFVLQIVSVGSLLSASPDTTAINSGNVMVVSAKSMSNRSANVVVLGDYIQLKVENLDQLLGRRDSCCGQGAYCDSTIVLCFNGIARPDMCCYDVDRVSQTLLFKFDRDSSKSVKKLSSLLMRPWKTMSLSNITVCIKGGAMVPTKVSKLTIMMMPHRIMLTVLLFLLGLLVAFYLLVHKTSLIRSGDKTSPFSLAQTQMGFWTILIAMSAIYIWAISGVLPPLTNETLVLMGISVATIAGSKMITYSQRNIIEPTVPSKGFIIDILSDNNNPNIHRFQMVLWTVILGVYFLIKMVTTLEFPTLDTNYLLLTGLSSGTYVLLKTSENSPKDSGNTAVVPPVPPTPPVSPTPDSPIDNNPS